MLAIGEALLDVFPSHTVLGGAPVNFSYRARALGADAWVASRVGRDPLAEIVLSGFADRRLPTPYLQRDDAHPTGTVDVRLDPRGVPTFSISPNAAWDWIAPEPALMAASRSADAVVYGTLGRRARQSNETISAALAATAGCRACDLNLRPSCWTDDVIRECLGQATVLKVSDEECLPAARAAGCEQGDLRACARQLASVAEVRVVALTLGDGGAFAVARDGSETYVPGYQVDVADTVGCGDAFFAAFLCTYLETGDLQASCLAGVAWGAAAATVAGAAAALTQEDVGRLVTASTDRHVDRRFLPG